MPDTDSSITDTCNYYYYLSRHLRSKPAVYKRYQLKDSHLCAIFPKKTVEWPGQTTFYLHLFPRWKIGSYPSGREDAVRQPSKLPIDNDYGYCKHRPRVKGLAQGLGSRWSPEKCSRGPRCRTEDLPGTCRSCDSSNSKPG